jgi:hypothetical protein
MSAVQGETQSAIEGPVVDPTYKHLWNRRCAVHNRLYVSYRYHRRRQRFFDLLDKGTKSATVLLGASLLGETVRLNVPLVASGISGLGLLALVFGYGERKQTHKELAEMCMQFIGKIEQATPEQIEASIVGEWEAEFARINAKEPPALKTLVIICEYEQAVAEGHKDHIQLPGLAKRILADFVS